jgi:RNA helicase armi
MNFCLTGKTLTIIELIKQVFTLDPTSNLIIATPSNSAANLFTSALVSSGMFKNPLDFVRFVSNNQVEKNLIPDDLQRYCATVSISATDSNRKKNPTYEIEGMGLRRNLTKFEIMGYRICIATLSCFGTLMQMKFPDDHFSHVIIDEAGQSTEAESLIPISLLTKSKGQVILAGDPLQLGPISHSRYVKFLKLDSSLLTRLLTSNSCYAQRSDKEYDPRFVTKLKINYRSLPSVLKVFNDMFYNSELEGAVNDETSSEAEMLSMILEIDILLPKPTGKPCGVFFVDVVKGTNKRQLDSCSWYNEEEINSITSVLAHLNMAGIEFKHIGIVSRLTDIYFEASII